MQNEVVEHQLESLGDEELMAHYQQGQVMAFDTLYHRHKGALYRYFLRQCREKSLAEDLYQDVWSRVIKASEAYQPSAKFTTWLYRIAYNRMADHVRSLKSVNNSAVSQGAEEPAADAADTGEGQDPQQQTERAQKAGYLKHCLSLLPPKQLEVFMLKEEGGFSAAMIAEIIEISHEAIKSRLRYSYQKLRECIAGKMQEAGDER
ncbi:sigma-70 family RNA polymerase sigma factor [Thalassomonas viridans]|uniref:Sigma-70 family RNA polymerase sigma factor n=1 Tax=Thalassomonas viridans TaxID=137584 RepID=A0AAE9Z748_9GAMM|nr:sigma-70 family RNA polymerase sigma factor [Thalassomonas viridans]WDE08016.1 sigma-70 family RNA polymerase sigma factor [Thalassomonas viridans]